MTLSSASSPKSSNVVMTPPRFRTSGRNLRIIFLLPICRPRAFEGGSVLAVALTTESTRQQTAADGNDARIVDYEVEARLQPARYSTGRACWMGFEVIRAALVGAVSRLIII